MVWNKPGSQETGGTHATDHRSHDADNQTPSPGYWSKLPGPFKGWNHSPLPYWMVGLVIVILMYGCTHLVREQQRGAVMHFGRYTRLLEPGFHVTWPWPIESVASIDATPGKTASQQLSLLTADDNIVNLTVHVQYQIQDIRAYLFDSRDANHILDQAIQSVALEVIGQADLDTVYNHRQVLDGLARERLQKALTHYHTGLQVTALMLSDAWPPDAVKPAFEDVVQVQRQKERQMSEASAYATRVVQDARGRAATIRNEAEISQQTFIAKAQGDAARFALLDQGYRQAPAETRQRLWLETMELVLSKNPKVIGQDKQQTLSLPNVESLSNFRPGHRAGPGTSAAIVPTTHKPADLVSPSGPPPAASPPATPATAEPSSMEPIRHPERTPRPAGRQDNPL